ncbi:MAG: GNAT family N-acetyltransferase [Solirubrobacteraceae bacterium]
MGIAELPFPTPSLGNEVVLLRRWRQTDVPATLTAFSDAVLQRFWTARTPDTEADVRSDFVELEQARLRGERVDLALVEPSNGDVVLGGGTLFDVDLEHGRAAVGYWLAPEARGRGVVTHAVRLIAGWAFEKLAVARLELTCGPDNHASQRVAERCGFTREGLLRSHTPFKDGRRDTVVFSLLTGELR